MKKNYHSNGVLIVPAKKKTTNNKDIKALKKALMAEIREYRLEQESKFNERLLSIIMQRDQQINEFLKTILNSIKINLS